MGSVQVSCQNCGYQGTTATVAGGGANGCLVVLLLCIGFVPGIIYLAVAGPRRETASCPRCGKLLGEFAGTRSSASSLALAVAALLLICGAAGALIIVSGSDSKAPRPTPRRVVAPVVDAGSVPPATPAPAAAHTHHEPHAPSAPTGTHVCIGAGGAAVEVPAGTPCSSVGGDEAPAVRPRAGHHDRASSDRSEPVVEPHEPRRERRRREAAPVRTSAPHCVRGCPCGMSCIPCNHHCNH